MASDHRLLLTVWPAIPITCQQLEVAQENNSYIMIAQTYFVRGPQCMMVWYLKCRSSNTPSVHSPADKTASLDHTLSLSTEAGCMILHTKNLIEGNSVADRKAKAYGYLSHIFICLGYLLHVTFMTLNLLSLGWSFNKEELFNLIWLIFLNTTVHPRTVKTFSISKLRLVK